jgi:hypothetical protein
MGSRFVCERLYPQSGSFDASGMAAGAPGVPREFGWRERRLIVSKVLRSWRETGPCRNGSGERYVRKHWFELWTEDGELVRVYFDRQARARDAAARWWLHSLTPEEHD